MRKKPCVLSIAGSDSSGGAGIQADLKAISATGGYAATVITGITAQNTLGVQATYPLPANIVKKQLISVFDDLNVKVVKIGAVFDSQIIKTIISIIHSYKPNWIVLDPVLFSKNGHALCNTKTRLILQNNLFSLVNLITPNIPEAEKIIKLPIKNSFSQKNAAQTIANKFQTNVLVKGGHFNNDYASDIFYSYATKTFKWFRAERINTIHTHGTGCSLSSAISSKLSQGYSLEQSIYAAKKYITQAILLGRNQKIGNGCGPIQHFF